MASASYGFDSKSKGHHQDTKQAKASALAILGALVVKKFFFCFESFVDISGGR
jgi:hypothetical protein